MAADYPTSVKSFATKFDNVDLVMAADVNDLQVEVAAIETQLVTSKLATLADAPVGAQVLTSVDGVPTWGGEWVAWEPNISAPSPMTYTDVTSTAKYTKIGNTCHFYITMSGTIGGTPSWYVQFNLPLAALRFETFVTAAGTSAGNPSLGYSRTLSSVGGFPVVVGNYLKGTLPDGTYAFTVSGTYEVA